MTKYPDLFAALAAPFEPHEVKTKPGRGGGVLHYITARQVMNRLDSVLGPENYWDEYEPWRDNGVLCRLTIRLPDGSTVTKQGIGGTTEMHDPSDTDKTGESDALRRAAVKLGVARYLYRDGWADFVREAGIDTTPPPVSRGHAAAPAPAQPHAREARSNGEPRPLGPGSNGQRPHDGPPRNGRGLFAWAKQQEDQGQAGLLRRINSWARKMGYPFRMADWDDDQVATAYAEACRMIGLSDPDTGEVSENARRQQLEIDRLVRKIHAQRTGSKAEPGNAAFYQILDEIAAIPTVGRKIENLAECRSEGLMGRYIAELTNLLGVEQGI